jgi:uncharacterized protein YfaS (alpha-2-macroglobulin family)
MDSIENIISSFAAQEAAEKKAAAAEKKRIAAELKAAKKALDAENKLIEANRKNALAEIGVELKNADAALERAAQLAEKYKVEFYWTTPHDNGYTYVPKKDPVFDDEGFEVSEEDDDYGRNAVGWTSSSDYC